MSEAPGIPDAALDAHLAIIGRTGSGKTYAARGMVERLLDQGRRVVILDPLSQWWGLKASADGSPGYPLTVIGGDHADLPIDLEKGAHLGAFIAKSQGAFVIDTSDLRRPECVRFVGALLAALYALNRDAIWVVIDEADHFAAQGATREMAPLAHEVDQIARRGRARGFRLWTITQRPARLDKSVLSQASSLLVMKLMAPQDRRAVEDWLGGNIEDAAGVTDALPQLPRGEGFFWNPDLGIGARIKLPRMKTLDTGFTPSADAAPIQATLAQTDVSALRLALGAAVAPLNPAAIRAEAYAQGRSDGAREEREKVRALLEAALETLQEAEDGPEATALPDDPPDAAQEPESAPAVDIPDPPTADEAHLAALNGRPLTNDAVQRDILGRINRPQRALLETLLEHGEQPMPDLARRAGLQPETAKFADNMAALCHMKLAEIQRGCARPTARLFPFGAGRP